MGFTTPAFIRKNTPELRKKLEEFGYNALLSTEDGECLSTASNLENYHSIRTEQFDNKDPYRTYDCAGRIDCETNEELFLAIAALRDDTDNNQMFINGKGDWGIYRDGSDGGLEGLDFYGMPNDLNGDNYHKATAEELIEHFKGKEESCQDL